MAALCKRGFTLVELSIVLVIIGLLIGGILVAQSMISTAKIQGIARQIGQYDAAIANFITKYQGLPGDKSGVGVCGGPGGETCDDGVVGNGSGYAIGRVWNALSLGVDLKNKKQQNYEIWDVFSQTTPDNCPQFDIPQNKTKVACLLPMWNSHPLYENRGVYSYVDSDTAMPRINDALKPVDVLAIDKKMDDGLATSTRGYRVVGIKEGSATVGNCTNGTSYDLSNNNFACSLYIEIGILSGVNR